MFAKQVRAIQVPGENRLVSEKGLAPDRPTDRQDGTAMPLNSSCLLSSCR